MLDKMGLFIGAGFSMEAGMPNTKEMTKEIKNWLTREKLEKYNQNWKLHNAGYDDNVLEEIIKLFEDKTLNFEEILGSIQDIYLHESVNNRKEQFWGLFLWVSQNINYLMVFRHINNLNYIKKSFPYYKGLFGLARNNCPLWIFSLNYDLLVELLCNEFKIPLKSGFTDKLEFIKAHETDIIFELNMNTISMDELNRHKLNFFENSFGINLLKIHGSIDTFTLKDEKYLAKLSLNGKSIENSLDMIDKTYFKIKTEINGIWATHKERGYNYTNEIAYMDKNNEMNYLRHTQISGHYKFQKKFPQTYPNEILHIFAEKLGLLSHLIIIGYSFTDKHINKILIDWLKLSVENKMEIVSPNPYLNEDFEQFKEQIELKDKKTSEFLEQYSLTPLNDNDIALKLLRGGNFKELEEFMTNIMSEKYDEVDLVLEMNSLRSKISDEEYTKLKEIRNQYTYQQIHAIITQLKWEYEKKNNFN